MPLATRLAVILFLATCTASHAANLTLTVIGLDNRSLPARILIRSKDGCVTPKGSTTFHNGPDTWFATNGSVSVDVPAGTMEIRIEHGLEYARFCEKVTVPQKLNWPDDEGCPNLPYLQEARKAGALINYNGGWDRECLLDAVLGHVHTVGICNNQFHLNRFQPRAKYSNLLNVPGFPIYPETPEGMLQLNTDTYYRLLNCGLRLAAGAGTAIGVKQSPPGWNRAYVQCKSNASYKDFCSAWAAGRNFVTNGPVILLSTADGKTPGDTIALPPRGGVVKVRIKAEAEPTIRISRVEIMVNGEVAATFHPDTKNKVNGEANITVKKGSWIAARCIAHDSLLTDEELTAYADVNVSPSNLRFAHTSPIYVTVDGKGAAVEKSLKEALLEMDCFEDFARKTADSDRLEPLLSDISKAREILRRKL